MFRRLFLAGFLVCATSGARADDVPCPESMPPAATCMKGKDANGAYYWIARPAAWNGILVVHSHGGPRLAKVSEKTSLEDLDRFAEMVREGYAWAGTSYRNGSYGVRKAAEDTEALRRIAIERIGKPRLTIAHGQSWGGNVAAKLIELFATAPDGSKAYDGALLTNGVLAGGSRGYDYRSDLRAVYQYLCNNHPRPSEPGYSLALGLPREVKMNRAELQARFNECVGANLLPEERSEDQKRVLALLAKVTRIPENALWSHLSWATFQFRDLVQNLLGGKSPFGNEEVRYAGSEDDDLLNRTVPRFRADPEALAAMREDSDLTGAVSIPVVTMHGIDDPTAFVEHEAAYRETLAKAGREANLVQLFVQEGDHSKLSPPHYPAALAALVGWIESGARPAVETVAKSCDGFRARHPGACRFDPTFAPKPYASRVYPR